MVTEGTVLGHKISATGLEVDQAKISLIKTLIPPTTVKGIRSFLRHAGFYRRFIKDFSKIARLLCKLLEKDAKFEFDEACSSEFEKIKAKLVIAPIMACYYAMGVVLGQRKEKNFRAIYYVAKPSMKLKKIIKQLRRKC